MHWEILMPLELSLLLYKVISSIFLPTIWLTTPLSYICSFLEAIFQTAIFNPSQKFFPHFSFQFNQKWQKLTKADKFPGNVYLSLFTGPLMIPLLFPSCWSLCSHHCGWVYRTKDEVKLMCFPVVPGAEVTWWEQGWPPWAIMQYRSEMQQGVD